MAAVAASSAEAASTINVRVQTTGVIAVVWHGDPARGCAAAGMCGVDGSVTYRPAGDIELELSSDGSAGFGLGEPDPAVVRVRGTTPASTPGGCVDLLPMDVSTHIDDITEGQLTFGFCGAGPLQRPLCRAAPAGPGARVAAPLRCHAGRCAAWPHAGLGRADTVRRGPVQRHCDLHRRDPRESRAADVAIGAAAAARRGQDPVRERAAAPVRRPAALVQAPAPGRSDRERVRRAALTGLSGARRVRRARPLHAGAEVRRGRDAALAVRRRGPRRPSLAPCWARCAAESWASRASPTTHE